MDRRAFLASAGACTLASASVQQARAQSGPRFAAALAFSAERGGAGLLIVRHGVVLAEDYPGGASVGERRPLGAGTRMLTPLLAASLVEDRLLNLDEAASLTLAEWSAHPIKSTISIRALLSGASGLAFGRNGLRDLNTALALEPVDAPGLRFSDDGASYILFAELAKRKLTFANRDPDPARYLTTRTIGRIGAAPIAWTRWPDGAPRLDDGAALSTRGWALLGELIRREGVWRGQQVVDEQVLREAQRGSFAEPRAGFGLWLAAPSRNRSGSLDVETDLWRGSSPAPIDLAMAAGRDGQRLYFSRTEGLVISRLTRERAPWSDAQFLTLVWQGLAG